MSKQTKTTVKDIKGLIKQYRAWNKHKEADELELALLDFEDKKITIDEFRNKITEVTENIIAEKNRPITIDFLQQMKKDIFRTKKQLEKRKLKEATELYQQIIDEIDAYFYIKRDLDVDNMFMLKVINLINKANEKIKASTPTKQQYQYVAEPRDKED